MNIVTALRSQERAVEKQVRRLARELDALRTAITALSGEPGKRAPRRKRAGRKMSAAGRAKIAAAQRARWAKIRAAKAKKAA